MAPVRRCCGRFGHCAIIIWGNDVVTYLWYLNGIIAINRKSHHKFLSADIILWLCIRGMQWKGVGVEREGKSAYYLPLSAVAFRWRDNVITQNEWSHFHTAAI